MPGCIVHKGSSSFSIYNNRHHPALTYIESQFLNMRLVTISFFLVLLYSCSGGPRLLQRKERVYEAPRMGAESRFEDGLRREKKPQTLFSKKEQKEMRKMGTLTEKERSSPRTRISPMQADSLLTGKTADTTHVIPTDSTRSIPADTTNLSHP